MNHTDIQVPPFNPQQRFTDPPRVAAQTFSPFTESAAEKQVCNIAPYQFPLFQNINPWRSGPMSPYLLPFGFTILNQGMQPTPLVNGTSDFCSRFTSTSSQIGWNSICSNTADSQALGRNTTDSSASSRYFTAHHLKHSQLKSANSKKIKKRKARKTSFKSKLQESSSQETSSSCPSMYESESIHEQGNRNDPYPHRKRKSRDFYKP